MRVWKMLGLILGVSALCALVGFLLGLLIDRMAPGYYRTVFPSLTTSGTSGAEVGMALGLVQGLVVGAFVGLVLVAILTWREHRSQLRADLDELILRVRELREAVASLEEQIARTSPRSPARPSGEQQIRRP